MKKQFLALSMIATSGLFAQTNTPMHRQPPHQSNCCNLCDCSPCCCTNPRPCVDCECYVPQFYNLQCDWGLSLDAEFLYWYARETNLSYAAKLPMIRQQQVPEDPDVFLLNTGVGSRKSLKTAWDPGFRVGIGFNSCCDGWDYNVTWTWFQNKQTNSATVDDFIIQVENDNYTLLGMEGQSVLVNPWINEAFGTRTFNRVKAAYRLRLNQIDLDLGRKYWLSECFNLRPFIGIRGAWTRVRFSTNSRRDVAIASGGTTTANHDTFRDRFKTRAWGVGLLGGLHPTWYFSRCFGLYGQIGTALIWGDFEIRKKESYTLIETQLIGQDESTTTTTYNDKGQQRHAQMTGILDLGIGLRWERTWCCDRYRSALDAGWEHHIYFDQNHRHKSFGFFGTTLNGVFTSTTANGYNKYGEETGDLCFGGFVLRLNFDF